MLAIERESKDAPHGFNQGGGLGWTLIGVERQPDDGPLSRRRRHGPEVEAGGVEWVNRCRDWPTSRQGRPRSLHFRIKQLDFAALLAQRYDILRHEHDDNGNLKERFKRGSRERDDFPCIVGTDDIVTIELQNC
ncbi:MAG: hypothetical protein WCA28_15205, partial [Bradyrhizobium sp.]